jgi:hypothetical protein
LKSKSCVGRLNVPPNLIATPTVVAVAANDIVTCEGESTLEIVAPEGIPVPITVPLTAHPTCNRAVEGILMMTFDPEVMSPVVFTEHFAGRAGHL